ncbi:hypothetical protein SSX86_001632 [Deinandra increscens subsp. villosa]|uniref:Transposase-associated domain-containing protein n=1 Tax=Deinandra increscens subsp. villosa TaxID=3103831 RepID=A0AAP0DVP9_9ASTR
MSSDREWMYTMRIRNGYFNPAFVPYVKYFLDFVFENPRNIHRRTKDGVEVLIIKCPCAKCKNRCYKTREEVEGHLYAKGFVDDYKVWHLHGESFDTQDVGQCSNPIGSQHAGEDTDDNHGDYSGYDQMVMESLFQTQHPYYRKQSSERAQKAGENITQKHLKFRIIRNYPPIGIADDVWHKLCDIWDTEEYRKKCEIAAKNRASADSNGKISRHTAGSIGYDEIRVRLRDLWGKEPSYKEIFLYTHLNKESKAKLRARELDISKVEEMVFCNDRARKAFDDYLKELRVVHGSIDTEDGSMWRRLQPSSSKRRIYGIGSSDMNYVVTGTPSSSCGIADSFVEQRKAQEKICKLEAQMEEERMQRDDMRQQMEEQKLEMERQRAEIQEQKEQQKLFQEFMKKYGK